MHGPIIKISYIYIKDGAALFGGRRSPETITGTRNQGTACLLVYPIVRLECSFIEQACEKAGQ
jgi:hypothetical protein